LLVGLVANSASAQARWPGWLEFVRIHPWHSLAVLTVVTVGLAALGVALAGEDRVAIALEGVADSLAIAVTVQWEAEARWRQLNDPYPMRVRWRAADSDVVVEWPALVKLATTGPGWPIPVPENWAAGPADLSGVDNDLADVLGRVPTGRLVVLGEPGAGKTILLVRLVLDLLARRRPGEAVPILLPLASWNPVEQDLFAWMERRLTTDNAALADPAPGRPGVSRAGALLDAGLILPVLDGLDEIPDATRGPAIARVNDAMRPGKRLILAARTQAYGIAVHPPGGVEIRLTGAAGIQLCPLDAAVVADYLKDSAGGPAGAARWDPIVAMLGADDPRPVARALTTPLMAALARANYNPRPDENVAAIPDHPVELLDPARFPNPKTIRLYLFDRFVPSAYRKHPDSPRIKCSAAEAERWLVFLARDLQHRQHGTTDLAWWELHGAAPRALSALTVGTVAGFAAAFGFSFPLDRGFDIGLGVAYIIALLIGLLVRRSARHATVGLTRGLVGGLLGGQLGAVVSLAIFGPGVDATNIGPFFGGGLALGLAVAPLGIVVPSLAGAFAGQTLATLTAHSAVFHELGGHRGPAMLLTNGVGFGLVIGVAAALANRRTPARGTRWSPLGLVCGIVTGLVMGTVIWFQAGPTGGLLVGLVGVITGGYAGGLAFEVAATDLTKATTPTAVLARDRAAFRLGGLGTGIAIGLSTGLAVAISPTPGGQLNGGLRLGLGVGLASLIGVGLAVGFLQASWGSFTLARWWLAASGRLPWRLMTFLADAHTNRGVLRQVGAVYQFRHAELQRRLATDVDRSAVIDAEIDPADETDPAGAGPADDGQSMGARPSANPGSARRSRVL
jgi:hypothetical protein